MKLEQKIRKLFTKAGRYKYAALILLLGMTLMLLPQREKKQPEIPAEQVKVAEELGLEEQLENILSRMEGVGETQVLLTLATGTAYQYQTDVRTYTKQEDAEVQKETVLASDGAGKESPITVRTTYPTYKGALVLCQGADSAAVRLDVTNAVSDLTGLGSDKITVIKMKDD